MTTTTRYRLILPQPYPAINAAGQADHHRGDVRYRIRGPRAAGTMVITPEMRGADGPLPTEIYVRFGDRATHEHECPDQPVINGVTLVGGVILTPDEYLARDRTTLGLRRATGPYTSIAVPTATNAYGSAIVRALVQTWHTRPDRDQLIRAAARRTAAARLAELHRTRIQPAQDCIDRLTRELGDHFRLADELHRLAREYADPGEDRP